MATQPLTVKPGTRVRLADFDPGYASGLDKATAAAETDAHIAAMDELVYRLYAENKRAVLLVLQGIDASGKDGTIRHVFKGIDPQACHVAAFKQPSSEELEHDFLWRIHREVPRRGNLGIFNRSHYEDVVTVRVHRLVAEAEWRGHYEQINVFEKLLWDSGTTILKFFLHISRQEQRKRLQARLDDPTKRWKFNRGDLEQRKLWDEYQEAYEDALTRCNTEHAPWYIVPADHKWIRNLIISRVLRETLERLDPQFPPADESLDGLVVE